MQIERCTKSDFDRIVAQHATYWDSDLTLQLHHPMFLHEFGDTAFVIRDGDTVAAYLFGFFAQTGPVGYVHLVAVHPDYRGKGLARRLYDHFIDLARDHGCTHIKATAAPTNAKSIRFHTSIGMRMLGEANAGGVPVVKGYLKPGVDRVVFQMEIGR
jgi:GNAT superfamily N-acetyltransferase